MPIPTPHAGEDESTYHSRCMGDPNMKEYPQDQRNAICYQKFRDKDKKKMDEQLIEEVLQEFQVSLSDVKDGLVRIAIAYTGDFERNGKGFSITEDDLKSIAKHLREREVPMDYEHLSAKPDAPPGHSRASGWIKSPDRIESFRGDSKILYGWAALTPASLTAIRAKEFKYFSPEIHWNDEDEEGKSIGTRIAAGALTNRPFLKALPPIEIQAKDFPQLLEAVALSELERLTTDVDSVHVPGDINTSNRKDRKPMAKAHAEEMDETTMAELEELRKMKGKYEESLKSKKLEGEELEELAELRKMKGKYEESMKHGKLKAEEMEELEELRKMHKMTAEEMEELAELRKLSARVKKGGDLYVKHEGHDGKDDGDEDDTKGLTEMVRQHNSRQREVVCLSEFAKTEPGDKTEELAETMLSRDQIPTAVFIRQNRIARMIDGAIQNGKILPKDRQLYYELAISNFDRVSQLLKEAKPVVDLKTRGVQGDTEGKTAYEELNERLAQYMKDHNGSDRAEALKEVTKADPGLWTRYQNSTRVFVEDAEV